ncbi:PIN domain-containing protein [Hirschfeldia incana]|nr:PIN domain-containing protein [Hirschfeldia incana]
MGDKDLALSQTSSPMMAEQQVREKTIPMFTVLKNGAILKNIFVVNSRDFSSPERNGNDEDDEVEQVLIVGRHPDCDILLTHPSISKYHLQIRSLPSRQKLFVTDLSSVDGTWVRDERVEGDDCVEVEEGDVIRIGASTRLYRLHWVPLSHAYDLDNPFVSDNTISKAESQADTESGDDGEGHLDVTSPVSGSSVPSEDEDTYINTREFSLASPSALTLARDSVDTQKLQSDEDSQTSSQCVIEGPPESPSKQQGLEDDECFVRGDVMSEMDSSDPETSSLPLLRDSTETEDAQALLELAINSVEAKAENPSKEQRPDVHGMSSNSKVNHEPVTPKKKAENSSSQSQSYIDAPSTASARNSAFKGVHSSSSNGKNKMKWTIVLDTSSLLDKESRKPLHLLQGLKGTHLVIPLTVLRELNETKRTWSLLFRRRSEIASSALDWIEECKVNTKWWIQLQSISEETKAAAPIPSVTPQSNVPTSEDQVLECALLYRNLNIYGKLVLLSNNVTLKIKAMAEDVICETPHEFFESLKNPLSERFMWPESLPRGRTWSHFDNAQRYNNRTCFRYKKKPTLNVVREESAAATAKGLKLILLLNSHYGHVH